jgi:preprotein translocase subunit SecA
MLKSIAKLIGGSSEKAIKKLRPLADEINEVEPSLENLSEEDLRGLTDEFRSRLSDGETLDDLLPEAFALVREASKRTLGMRHFDVQIIGGIVLHQGKIAEMRTGEGKTLVATLPAYLNGMAGNGVHIVTVNDYLARRDAQWMGAVYHMLGLTTGVLQADSSHLYDPDADGKPGSEKLRNVSRREAYAADITYGTNNDFGFDYLRDNMVIDLSQRVQRDRVFAIVDEVDNILIDEARTPLIISGPAEESPKEYGRFAKMVPALTFEEDYAIDEKHRAVTLTPEGMSKLEVLLNVENLYDPENVRQVHFVENALKAQALFERDKEYIVKDGEVVIVDEFTGRQMPGRRFSDGLHQALEAKESVTVQRESITYATITLQNYFRVYSKLSGMTGTAATEAEEFWKIYKLEVVDIPTNVAMVRDDTVDQIFSDQKAKYEAVINAIAERHEQGQPVLVGTTDISRSEVLSERLKKRGIPHQVLNAKQHAREAAIVAEAGRPGAVTVATNMAGRGTDIVLGGNPDAIDISRERWDDEHRKVVEAGGLHIIGTERHEARRIDNQLRGRAGRQGDAGSTRFYVALDDSLMRRFGGDKIQAVMNWAGMDSSEPLENKMISRSIEGAQVKVEAFHFDTRKQLVEYDDVINTHRTVIYGERNKVLSGADLKTNIQEMIESELPDVISRHLDGVSPEDWDVDALMGELLSIFPLEGDLDDPDVVAEMDQEEIFELVMGQANALYEKNEVNLGPDLMRVAERQVMLRTIDANWVPHLTAMENLRQGIGLHAYGQRDPLVMYKREGMEMFETLKERIQYDIVHTIYRVVAGPSATNGSEGQAKKRPEAKSIMAKALGNRPSAPEASGSTKVGRNDTCPCGSGKKYKKCHGTS